MCINEPVKRGHLYNQDSLLGPKVSGMDRFDCITNFVDSTKIKGDLFISRVQMKEVPLYNNNY